MEFKKDQKLRSYDFPGEHLKKYYIEGNITQVENNFIHLNCIYDNSGQGRTAMDFIIPIIDATNEAWGYSRLEII